MEKEGMSSTLDFTGRGLTKIEVLPSVNPTRIIYDRNAVSKLENLDHYKRVQELSVADNRIVRMNGVERLRTLRILNLPNNSIGSVEGLQNLKNLTWLNLSGNSIKVMENLSACVNLQHLDFSDNCISSLSDISSLLQLRALLLHGNMVGSLKPVPDFLPASIVALSLAENELSDLSEIPCLSCLRQLEQLSVMNNPMTAVHPAAEYRPLVISHCDQLKVLDGSIISEKERLKAQWYVNYGLGNHCETGDVGVNSINGCLEPGLTEHWPNEKGRQPTVSHSYSLQGSTVDSQIDSIELTSEHTDPHHSTSDSRLTGKPRAAWCDQEGPVTLAISPQTDPELTPACNTAEWTDDSSSDLLESESVYLPVGSPLSPNLSQSSSVIVPQNKSQSSAITHQLKSQSLISGPQQKSQSSISSPQQKSQSSISGPQQKSQSSGTVQQKSQSSISASQQKTQSSISGPQQKSQSSVSTPSQRSQTHTKSSSSQVRSAQSTHSQSDREGGKTIGATSRLSVVAEKGRVPSHTAPQVSPSSAESHSRFESYEERAIKPLNQEIARSRAPPPSQPKTKMELKMESKIGNRKSLNFVQDSTKGDLKKKEVNTQSAMRSQALSHIKDVAESRKNMKKGGQQQQQQQQQQVPSETSVKSNIGKRLVREAWQAGGVRDSGFLSRPTSDAIDIDRFDQEKAAATKIQCMWRGYWAREHAPRVKWVREEMRRRRMEEHIVYLRAELERQKMLYKEEKQLRNLQLEAIKHLWKEVQVLQTWKASVLSEPPSCTRHKHLNKELENTMEKIEVISEQGYITENRVTSPLSMEPSTGKHQDLERTCAFLQAQVQHLHQTLQGLSHLVHSSAFLSQAFEDPCRGSREGGVRVTGYTGHMDSLSVRVAQDAHWSLVSVGEDEPRGCEGAVPGCPTPPSRLQLHHRTVHSLVLSWQPSEILGVSQQQTSQPVLGYRVYVNDVPYGMVPGHQTSAVVDGLDTEITYKFHVKAVSSIGESDQSNRVSAEPGQHKLALTTSSSDNPTDDSDDEHGSTGSQSDDQRKQKGDASSHQRTKKKSPRREKEVRRSLEKKTVEMAAATPHEEDPSRKDSSSADEMTIFRYPRLHTPKRGGRNKTSGSVIQNDLKIVSYDNDQGSIDVDAARVTLETPHLGVPQKCKAADHVHISTSPKSLTSTDSSPKQTDDSPEYVQKQRRLRTKDGGIAETGGDVLDSSVQVRVEDASTPPEQVSGDRDNDAQNEASVKEMLLQADKAKESKCPQETRTLKVSSVLSKGEAAKAEGVRTYPGLVLSKPKPVPNTKRKPLSGPNSPHSGSVPHDVPAPARPATATTERRRTPVVDMLEQRFANKQNSMQDSGAGNSGTGNSKPGSALVPKMKTADSIKLSPDGDEEENLRRSKSENSSPTEKSQPAIATGSDSDTAVPFSIKSRTQGSFVSKLLQKLQTFSKAQEQSIRQSQKTLKSRAKSSSDTALAGGEAEDGWAGRRRRISGGEDSEEEARAVLSDSAHCSPSSEKRANKGHRRSSSMHGAGPYVAKESHGVEGGYSPIIMDGARKKTSPTAGSSNVRRHASFHGILPSKGQEIRQPSEQDNSVGKMRTAAPKPSPTESSGQPTFRSRSPSPNASARSGVYQPVLSAAQLQRLKSPAGIGH